MEGIFPPTCIDRELLAHSLIHLRAHFQFRFNLTLALILTLELRSQDHAHTRANIQPKVCSAPTKQNINVPHVVLAKAHAVSLRALVNDKISDPNSPTNVGGAIYCAMNWQT